LNLLIKLAEAIALVKQAQASGLEIYISDTQLSIKRGGFDPREYTREINAKIHKAIKKEFNI